MIISGHLRLPWQQCFPHLHPCRCCHLVHSPTLAAEVSCTKCHQMPAKHANTQHPFFLLGGVGMLDVRCLGSKLLSKQVFITNSISKSIFEKKHQTSPLGHFLRRPSNLASWISLRCFWLQTEQRRWIHHQCIQLANMTDAFTCICLRWLDKTSTKYPKWCSYKITAESIRKYTKSPFNTSQLHETKSKKWQREPTEVCTEVC